MKKHLFAAAALLLPSHFALAAPCTPAELDSGMYDLLVPIGTLSGCVDLGTYLSGMFVTVIGIAGVIAVVMIVVCGIRLMTSGSAGGKSEAKNCITSAIFGLLLAIASWIILYTINPFLVVGKPTAGVVPAPLAAATPSPSAPSGTLNWEAGPSCPARAGTLVSVAPPVLCPGVAPSPTSVCCRYVSVPITPPTPTPPPPVVPPIISPYTPTPTNGPVWVDPQTLRVNEGAGTVTFTVRRAGTIPGTVTYTTTAGTASAGADYSSVSGTLNFAAGVMSLPVSVPIQEDTLVEGDERFTLTLSGPTGGLVLGTPISNFATIVDNDIDTTPPVVNFLYPPNRTVTTTADILSRFNASEETWLSWVDWKTLRASTSEEVTSGFACSTSPTCPLLGGTFSETTGIGPFLNEYYNVVARACDNSGNCGYATNTVGLTDTCVTTATTTCFTLPSGTGVTTSPVIANRINSHLVKLATTTGGGTITINDAGVIWEPPKNPMYCGFFPQTLCDYGCDTSDPWSGGPTCLPPPPDPCVSDGLFCAYGCDVTSGMPMCYIPKPIIVASLAPQPGDVSVGAPCGNGGSFPGGTSVVINFGSIGCILNPLFNYFLNITSTDGLNHDFRINYSWNP